MYAHKNPPYKSLCAWSKLHEWIKVPIIYIGEFSGWLYDLDNVILTHMKDFDSPNLKKKTLKSPYFYNRF
jgi:hypothetical protein